jgi:hypothetical protein
LFKELKAGFLCVGEQIQVGYLVVVEGSKKPKNVLLKTEVPKKAKSTQSQRLQGNPVSA